MSRVIPLLSPLPFAILGVKWWLFPGWTWGGVFLAPEGVVSVLVVATILVGGLLVVSRKKNRGDGLARGLQQTILVCGLIAAALAYFGERDPLAKFLQLCDDGNWSYARKEVETLQQLPLRQGLIRTALLYVESHVVAGGDTVNESTSVRELRSAVKQLLNERENHKNLNTLSYAELSKYLYFKEGKSESTILEGIQSLQVSLKTQRNSSHKGPLLLKLGELFLAKQDYISATETLSAAMTALTSAQAKARALASWSTSLAAQGDWKGAIDKYREAEKLYPEGRREIYYSNFAYMLCQRAMQLLDSGKAADAESHLEEAESFAKKALLVKKDDWISILNLALIQDDRRKFAEAALNYKLVIGKAANSEIVSESWLLYGRSLHLDNRPLADVVRALLEGLGRASDEQIVNFYVTEGARLKELFAASAKALGQMPPHGLERYIKWFNDTGSGF